MNTASAYTELGLKPGASEREVKAAWRRLVSRWHPDRNDSAGAHVRMQRINQALEAIRRAGFAAADDAGRGMQPAAGEQDGASHEDAEPARDDDAPGRTLQRKVKLTLEEAVLGCTKTIAGRYTDPCTACAGVGHHTHAGRCPSCAGSGSVRRAGWYGLFSSVVDCADCGGRGDAREPCAACAGSGKLGTHRYRVGVRIPHGVRDGDWLHVDAKRARAAGTLRSIELRVEVAKHPLFALDDDGTLRCTLPVDGFAWVANRRIDVPTPDGLKPLALDRGQRCYRLPDAGFPTTRRGPRGDLLVTIEPVFPERFSADQQILLDQLLATTKDARLDAWQRKLGAWQRGAARRRHG